MKKIINVFISVILAIFIIFVFNIILDNELERLSVDKDISAIRHTQGIRTKYNGSYFRDLFLKSNDLMLLGSSELGSKVQQNPTNLFPFNGANYDVSTFGVAHIQNLQHGTMLGGSNMYNENSKLAMVVSLQWFEENGGIGKDEFSFGFSSIQFYQFLDNPEISLENKQYYAGRIMDLLESSEMFKEEYIYAKAFLGESIGDKIIYYGSYPYFKFKKSLLETRDKIAALKELRVMPEKEETEIIKEIDFEKEYIIAEEQGESLVTNNRFYAEDDYYDEYLRDIEEALENKNEAVDLMNSVEYDDFKFNLDVCKDLGIKPYIILMNVNGWYYDYIGITEDKRTEFYNKLESIATEKGFDVLNLQEHEYEKYYLTDVMHLGWKGWLNVSEEMSNHFKD
jgi:D-alanine transfer protein